MWINKNHWIIMRMRINRFHLPLLIPIRCFDEVVAAITDLMLLFRIFHPSITLSVQALDGLTYGLRNCGAFDLIDIDVKNSDGIFQMKLKLR